MGEVNTSGNTSQMCLAGRILGTIKAECLDFPVLFVRQFAQTHNGTLFLPFCE